MKKILTLFFLAALVCLKGWGQTAANYSFAASSGTYSAISGATPVTLSRTSNGSVSPTDEGYYNGIPLNFTFYFAGTAYTQVNVNSNGWFTLGTSSTPNQIFPGGSYNANDFTSLYAAPTIAPLWDDIAISTNSSDISYVTTGTAPNRIFTIQYNNVRWDKSVSSASIAFQVKLYETSNKIDFIYNQLSGSINSFNVDASIGIASASGAYLSLNNATSAPTASSSSNSTDISTKPTTGQVYTFSPPLPPSNITFTPTSACSGSGTTVTISGNNLSFTTTVKFNGISASSIANVNSTTVTAVLPNGATSGPITLTTAGGTATSTTNFTVNAKPTVVVTPTAPTVCSGTSTLLTASGADTYSWTPTSGLSATTGSSVTATPTTSITYIVTGTTTATGCTNTASSVITVNQPPTISTSGQPSNQTTCGGTAKTFTVTATGTSPTYQWLYSADGSTNWANVINNTPANITYTNSTQAILTVTPTTSATVGSYYYRCIVSVNGCATPATSNAASLTVNQAATVTIFTPTTGQAGTSVAITGTNFTGISNVLFNGVAAASFVVNSSTSITTVAPSGVTTGNITFTDLCGNTVAVGNFKVLPTITSFTPSSGCPNVATVVITGTNFTGATAVTIGGTSVSSFIVNSATKITATVGSGTSGIIAVTNIAGTATSASAFTFNPAIPASPGTITGTVTQCPALTNQTYSISSVATATSYAWTVPTGWTITSGQGSTSINVTTGSSSQNGNISVASVNGCGSSSDIQTIILSPINITNNTGYTSSSTKTSGDITVASTSAGDNGPIRLGYLKFPLNGIAAGSTITSSKLNLTNFTTDPVSTLTNYVNALGNNDPTTTSASVLYNAINNGVTYNSSTWSNSGIIGLTLNSTANTDIQSRISSPSYIAMGLVRGDGTSVYNFYGYGNVSISPQLVITYTQAKSSLAVTVSSNSVAGTISGAATVCAASNNTTLTLKNYTGIIQWQSSTDNSNFTNITNATNNTYTANNLSATTYYRAVVTNGNCSSATSASVAITVNPLPTATITASSNKACLNATQPTITFAGANGTAPYTFTYKISGDATTHTVASSGISVTATVSVPTAATGTFTYTLNSVKDASSTTCSNTITSNNTTTVTVNALPKAFNLTSGSYTVCYDGSNAPDFALDGSENGVTYQLLRNGNPVTAVIGTGNAVDFGQESVAGTYTAVATNSGSCSTNMGGSATVTVAAQIISYNVSGSGTFCGQAVVTLSGSQTGVTYHLSGGTLLSQSGTGNALSFTVTASGTYSIYATAGACNNPMSGSATITINPLPVVSLTSDATNNTSCVNNNITYTTDGGQSNYVWIVNGTAGTDYAIISGGTGSTNTITVKWLTSGSKTVSVNYNNSNGCTATTATSSSTTVNPIPTDHLLIAATPASICIGSSTSIIISGGTPGNTLYYTVDNESEQSATIGSGGNVTINTPTYNTPGTSTYTLVSESNASGCSVPVNGSATITINSLPIVYPISGKSYVAVGNTVNLSELTKNGTWTIDNTNYASLNSSTANPVSVTGTAVGTPVVTYTTATDNNGCVNSTSLSINVYNPAIAGYRTTATGNFSDPSIWEVNAGSGNWEAATTVPGSNNNIEVRHNLVIDQDYSASATANFSITNFNGVDGSLTIAPNHYFSSLGNVDFGGKVVTVKSTTAGTGAIGYMASTISGATHVTVERYIPLTVDANLNRAGRSWRLLTSPVTGMSINAAWQEGQLWNGDENNHPAPTGYGTLMTGHQQGSAANANSHGYDYWDYIQNGNSSIRYYSLADNATSGLWTDLPGNGLKDANGNYIPLNSYPAYLLFIRGDRSQTSPPASGATTLRATGTLNQGNDTITVPGAKAFTLVGNPFASMIDFEQIYNSSQNIQSLYWRWNATNNVYGGYDLIQRQGDGSYTTVPSPINATATQDNDARYIESGQGFFVQPVDNTGGSVVIGENAKANAQKQGSVFRENNYLDKKLYVNLNLLNPDSSTILADGVLARYDKSYSSNLDDDDVNKAYNMYENLSIGSHGSYLIVEARPDIQTTDTLQLKLWNTTQRGYQLQMKTDRFDSTIGLRAWLEDNYLHTKTEVNLHSAITTVSFTITADTASQSINRFKIVFKNEVALLPVTLTSVKAAPQNGGVSISWTVANEMNIKDYTVERSTDGGRSFSTISTLGAKNLSGVLASNYNSFDANPKQGNNLYRIRIESSAGNISYSAVAKVTIGDDKEGLQITFYPNPVRDSKINLQLSNLVQGVYLISIYSSTGQSIYQKKIAIAQSNTVQSEELKLSNALAEGSYNLHIIDNKGATVYLNKFIVAR